eukprot:2880210-Heterocapsa_arctica.AAC.1
MAGAIAGKHMIDYVRAIKATEGVQKPLIIAAVLDMSPFYEEELAHDPFKMDPCLIIGQDKI